MYLLIHLSIYIFTCLCIFIHLCIYLFSYILCVYIFLHIMYSFIYPCMSNFYDFLMLDICLLWFANFEGTVVQADITSLQLTAFNVPGMSQSVIHLQTIQRCTWFFSQGPGVITFPLCLASFTLDASVRTRIAIPLFFPFPLFIFAVICPSPSPWPPLPQHH